jgi:hypothetical protein
MSEQDQDQLIGRLVRERKDVTTRNTALSAQIDEVGKALESLGKRLQNYTRAEQKTHHFLKDVFADEALAGWDFTRIQKLVKELDAGENRLRDIQSSLARLGI